MTNKQELIERVENSIKDLEEKIALRKSHIKKYNSFIKENAPGTDIDYCKLHRKFAKDDVKMYQISLETWKDSLNSLKGLK